MEIISKIQFKNQQELSRRGLKSVRFLQIKTQFLNKI